MAEESTNPAAPAPQESEETVARLADELRKRLLEEVQTEEGDAILDRILSAARVQQQRRRPRLSAVELAGLLGSETAEATNRQLVDVLRELGARQTVAEKSPVAEHAPKTSIWPNVIPALITGVTFATMALGIFVSLNSSMGEIQKTSRDLAVQIATATSNTTNLSKNFEDFKAATNGRFDKVDAHFDKVDARFDKLEEKIDTRLKAIEDLLNKRIR